MSLIPGQKSIQFQYQKATSEKVQLEKQQTETVVEYNNYAVCHGHHPSDYPTPIRHHQWISLGLRSAIVAGAIMASLVFGFLNSLALSGSLLWIWTGSLVFALLVGCVVAVAVSRWARVNPLEPRSSVRADGLLIASGLGVILSLSTFLYLRFSDSEYARSMLPSLAMLFELSTLVGVSAASALLPLYDWSIKQSKEFHLAQLNINVLDARIAACKTLLEKESFSENKKESFYENTKGGSYENKSDADRLSSDVGDGFSKGKPRKPNGSAAAAGDDQRAG
jgi:hypothetical protein